MEVFVCEKCGKEFDEWTAETDFEEGVNISLSVSYHQLGRCLCGPCAIEEFNNGNYFETCECCGKQFYPCTEQLDFDYQVSKRITDADMYEYGVHCADCAAKKILDSLPDEELDEDDERLSVYDAAMIWISHGKDEDYMFGYSEEELESAL